jgi:transcriptional regulator with XRE-family HTH domain
MTKKDKKGERPLSVEALRTTRGERMRARRKLLGLTQAYLTSLLPDATDNNPNAVGRIETGEVAMTDTRAVYVSLLLRVPLAWLYGLEGWGDVPPDEDPYLDRDRMYEQFLGARQIDRMTSEIDEDNEEARIELLNILVKNEIKKVGIHRGLNPRSKSHRKSNRTA